MDESLKRLRRAHEADRADPQAARAYDHGLRRAGETDEVERLYAFKFKCDIDWCALPIIDFGGSERHCDRCDRSVHFVRSRGELATRVQAGECVAFDPSDIDALAFVVEDAGQHLGEEQASPCLVEGDLSSIPLPAPLPPMAGAPREIQRPPESAPRPRLGDN
ncbi:MAG: hypothetical protein JKY65_17990 [Planctomycetes bacterium]|nr:hypothetical protein [Planctomycetota bacterium]